MSDITAPRTIVVKFLREAKDIHMVSGDKGKTFKKGDVAGVPDRISNILLRPNKTLNELTGKEWGPYAVEHEGSISFAKAIEEQTPQGEEEEVVDLFSYSALRDSKKLSISDLRDLGVLYNIKTTLPRDQIIEGILKEQFYDQEHLVDLIDDDLGQIALVLAVPLGTSRDETIKAILDTQE